MLSESQVSLATDFVGGGKFGTILELRRNRRCRIVVRGQLAMTLDQRRSDPDRLQQPIGYKFPAMTMLAPAQITTMSASQRRR